MTEENTQPQIPSDDEIPTSAILTAGARSIDSTIKMDKHIERAKQCWKAMIEANNGILPPLPTSGQQTNLDEKGSNITEREDRSFGILQGYTRDNMPSSQVNKLSEDD